MKGARLFPNHVAVVTPAWIVVSLMNCSSSFPKCPNWYVSVEILEIKECDNFPRDSRGISGPRRDFRLGVRSTSLLRLLGEVEILTPSTVDPP